MAGRLSASEPGSGAQRIWPQQMSPPAILLVAEQPGPWVLSSSSLAASVGLEARAVLGFLSVMAVAYSRVKSNRCFVVVFFCLWGVGRYILSIVKSTQCLLTAKPADVHSAIVGKPNRER